MSLIEKITRLFAKSTSKKLFGISLRQNSVAYCCVAQKATEKRNLSYCKEMPLMASDYIHTLAELSNQEDLQGQCQLVLSASQYNIIQVDRPNVPENEIAAALKWQIKDLVPCAPENMVIDYFYGPALPDGTERLYVICSPLDMLQKLVARLANEQLQLTAIITEEFAFARLPHAGIGLARLEFIINKMIGVHPKALLNFSEQSADLQDEINDIIVGYESPIEFYIAKLTEGISTLAAAYSPEKVIVRMSDFKSNEYANLVGGEEYEPEEENPMIGYRGAARYISEDFRDCFALECEAIKRVRNDMGLTNVEVMIPFVRTLGEAEAVIEILAEHGLKRGENGLRIIMMCELPSNALLADQFLDYFDGFSIGSNDLTQLTLGLDRDSGLIAHLFDERDPAIKILLSMAIKACKARGKYVGICGQGPSDHEDFAAWLVEQGIDSVSLNPDTVLPTWLYLAESLKNKE